ncbi:MAG: hypothetical protein WCI47_00485 [bacterium]
MTTDGSTFISLILSVVVIGGLIMYLRASKSPSSKSSQSDQQPVTASHPPLDAEFVARHWAEIQTMMKSGGSGLKNALSEADKLLDYVMQGRGLKGENMGDRLKLNGKQFSNLNAVWSAHKLRNRYAHEVHIDVVPREVEVAIASLGQGIKDLDIRL